MQQSTPKNRRWADRIILSENIFTLYDRVLWTLHKITIPSYSTAQPILINEIGFY